MHTLSHIYTSPMCANWINILGPVAQRPIIANPGLNFNPGFLFFYSKALFQVIFSILFRVSYHQIVDKKNSSESAFSTFISEFKILH